MTRLFRHWYRQSKIKATGNVTAPRKQRVLVIDDDQSFLIAAGALLEGLGYEVTTLSSGKRAIDLIRHQPDEIDIVLLDYVMPGFDGLETLLGIRALGVPLKIVGMTGFAMADLSPQFVRGVDQLLQKPFQSQELIAALENLTPQPVEPEAVGAGL